MKQSTPTSSDALRVTYIAADGTPQIIFEGPVPADLTAHLTAAIVKGPGFDGGRGLIVDVARHTEYYETSEVKMLARSLGRLAPEFGARCALVIEADDSLGFGLARMFSAYSEMEGLEVAIFFDVETARPWVRGRSS